jgi:hypothetical protein
MIARSLKAGGVVPFALRSLLRKRTFLCALFGIRSYCSKPFLDSPDQLVLLAGERFPVIIGEFAPTLARRASEPLPPAFNLVPIHVYSFSSRFPGLR